MATIKNYGEWASPITAARVAQGARPLSGVRLRQGQVYWLEGRASEGGRNTLLRAGADGAAEELTPAPYNVRTRVHEYGGGAYVVAGEWLVFSHFATNQLFAKRDGQNEQALLALGNPDKQRYADFIVDAARQRIIGVREDHTESSINATTTLCSMSLDGSGKQVVLAEGHDFYSSPRLSPDGKTLAWMTWDHPRMPWQGTQLWLADIAADGSLQAARCVAGSESEAICQPEWSPAGELFFVSDRSGWWNLYRLDMARNESHALLTMEAEFSSPHWTFGDWTYGFLNEREIACSYIENGVCKLAKLTPSSSSSAWQLQLISTPYTDIHEIAVSEGKIAMLAAGPTIPLQLVEIDLINQRQRVLASSIDELPDSRYLSVPEDIRFPSGDRHAFAMYYPPKNDDFIGSEGSKPPLAIFIHGGPTGMASNGLRLAIQFWTSRGFAVLDVNYAGSAGYGRAYRDLLAGKWGVYDVEDCVNGARYLVAKGLVDAERLVIRGGSAGGFTTMSALIFHDVFKAGASLFGVADLAGLDEDSHKFESQYNNYLIGPREKVQEIYQQRSPVHHMDKIKRPMIFLQGSEDRVVPPAQSHVMVNGLRSRGVPVAYLEFAGEGHGFRQAANITRALEAELYFYAKVFGFELADAIAPVEIENF